MIISSKAGYLMWPGPYGEWGSRKYLVASCDQSLKRMGLQYVDIFYSHRFDPDTPLEETMGALDFIVRSGRALYAGISSYDAQQTARAAKILRDLGTPCLIHQPKYNMFDRWIENGLTRTLEKEKIGCIVFSPLAQGLLTHKYLDGIPEDSRAAKHTSLDPDSITPDKVGSMWRCRLSKLRRPCSTRLASHQPPISSTIAPMKLGMATAAQAVSCVTNTEISLPSCSTLGTTSIVSASWKMRTPAAGVTHRGRA